MRDKISIVQHIPAYIDGGVPEVSIRETIEDILNLFWVKKYSYFFCFKRFSKSFLECDKNKKYGESSLAIFYN